MAWNDWGWIAVASAHLLGTSLQSQFNTLFLSNHNQVEKEEEIRLLVVIEIFRME